MPKGLFELEYARIPDFDRDSHLVCYEFDTWVRKQGLVCHGPVADNEPDGIHVFDADNGEYQGKGKTGDYLVCGFGTLVTILKEEEFDAAIHNDGGSVPGS